MFARFLEMTVRPDKKSELINAIKNEIIPMFKSHEGFFGVLHLEVETDPAKFYAISMWHDRRRLEEYVKNDFPRVRTILEPFLTAPIIVRHCTVDETISMKLAAAVAA